MEADRQTSRTRDTEFVAHLEAHCWGIIEAMGPLNDSEDTCDNELLNEHLLCIRRLLKDGVVPERVAAELRALREAKGTAWNPT